MIKNIIVGSILTLCAFFLVSCSSSSKEVKKESGWWAKTKCKIVKKNDECD